MTLSILFLIALALTFDFLNGFHDSANSIATVVSTRVLSPRYAVIWAAFFNFVAFLVFWMLLPRIIPNAGYKGSMGFILLWFVFVIFGVIYVRWKNTRIDKI